jgi:hypothetical protein
MQAESITQHILYPEGLFSAQGMEYVLKGQVSSVWLSSFVGFNVMRF